MMKAVAQVGTLLALIGAAPLPAQQPRGVIVVAAITTIHSDSAGRAFQGSHNLSPKELDSMLVDLQPRRGATIWFSWDGGASHPRTPGEEALLTRLRKSGVRVELRTDSTRYSRVVR
jgi:hypothetical protein